jgi:hypothetical protein
MRNAVYGILGLIVLGCGGGGSGTAAQPAAESRTTTTRGSANLITESEINSTAYQNALEVVTNLRPAMMRPRPGGGPVMFYLDNVKMMDLNGLSTVPSGRIKEIRYINSQDATTRWGTGHASGVILVITKR